MLLRFAALGALGYAGYRYYQQNQSPLPINGQKRGNRDPHPLDIDMAGGPLSSDASIIHKGDDLPA